MARKMSRMLFLLFLLSVSHLAFADKTDVCLNCHDGYDAAVEPGSHWKGSMMAQASRDFLFWSCMTVAAQDSIWAVGTPNATDICERCHFPIGWLEGRSDPTNNSAYFALQGLAQQQVKEQYRQQNEQAAHGGCL